MGNRHATRRRLNSVLILSAVILFAGAVAAEDLSNSYEWRQVKIGGGGFVTGIVCHPTVQDLLYCRTDVGGAYRLDPGTDTWTQIVTSKSMPQEFVKYAQHKGVDAIAVAASQPDLLYIAYGGMVLRSRDRGSHFVAGDLKVAMDANDEGRFARRLTVDPANGDVVYYGSRKEGLWRTTDGEHWQRLPGVPAGATSDKGAGGVIRVQIDPSGRTVAGRSKRIYACLFGNAKQPGGVYVSQDGSESWKDISSANDKGPGPTADLHGADLGPDGNLVCCSGKKVWKHTGEAWADLTPAKLNRTLVDVAVDPSNVKRIIATADNGEQFRTTDGGATWTAGLKPRRLAPDIPWQQWCNEEWFSTAEVIFDPHRPGRLWTAQGIGVWFMENLDEKTSVTWTAKSKGIEELCPTDLIVPPGGKPIGTVWDRTAFGLDDGEAYPATHIPANYSNKFSSGWNLAYQADNPKFIVMISRNHMWWFNEQHQSGWSDDGGKTWTVFPSILDKTHPKELVFGDIAVSTGDPDNIVQVPHEKKMPFYTTDRGKTWQQSTITANGKAITTGGYNRGYFVRKKLIVADLAEKHTFLLYHWEHGLFKSVDGGKQFELISNQLPGWRWHPCLRAVLGKPGHFWFAGGLEDTGRSPLFRSTDGGKIWKKLTTIDEVSVIGFGKAADKSEYPAIYVEGKKGGQSGVFRSTDEGVTWDFLTDYPLGIFDKIVAISGDMDQFGQVYVAFSGNGFAYGKPKHPR